MIQYLIKRIIYGILVLWGVLTLVFFLFTVLPGDPARMMLDQREDSQQLRTLKQKYGFDKSISTQYFLYLNDLSPLSIHSKNNDAFNYVLSGKYNYRTILEMKSSVLVLKTPYLRESFAKRGKSGNSIARSLII